MSPRVVVLDYGSGNVRSAVRMLQRVGAQVELTADPADARAADGLYVPGVGNFHSCVRGLAQVGAADLIADRVGRQAPVLGVCVGMQALFAGSTEPSEAGATPGLGYWPAMVDRLSAPVVPHMGWSPVTPGAGSRLLAGAEGEHFYFVHSYAAQQAPPTGVSTWAEHGAPFVAAVEDGPLAATQFHPEKSGDAGAALLSIWLETL